MTTTSPAKASSINHIRALLRSECHALQASCAAQPDISPGLYTLLDDGRSAGYRIVDPSVQKPYDVVPVRQLLDVSNEKLASRLAGKRVFGILDASIARLYEPQLRSYFDAHGLECHILRLKAKPNNEDNKNIHVYAELIGKLMEQEVDADQDIIVGVGGGVVRDLVGYVASTIRRGVPYLLIPTTVAAICDAAISTKTSINITRAKNAVGTNYAPVATMWDPKFLATAPQSAHSAGMAEIVKIAVMRSPELFEYIEAYGAELIEDSFQSGQGFEFLEVAQLIFLKMRFEPPFAENCSRSASMRPLRSFGHHFSRKLESLEDFELLHGEAVAIEMAVAAQLSNIRGLLPKAEAERLLSILNALGLPIHSSRCRAADIWMTFARKTQQGKPFRFPIPGVRIGRGSFLDSFTEAELRLAIECCRQKVLMSKRKMELGAATTFYDAVGANEWIGALSAARG